MKKVLLSLLLLAIVSTIAVAQKPKRFSLKEAANFTASDIAPEGRLNLWYKQPAKIWEDALPVGNGRLGAMVYGGIAKGNDSV